MLPRQKTILHRRRHSDVGIIKLARTLVVIDDFGNIRQNVKLYVPYPRLLMMSPNRRRSERQVI